MKVEIQIDEKIKEDKIIVQAKEMTDEISDLMKKISSNKEKLTVYLEEETYFISEEDIETVYSRDSKVYIRANNTEYITKKRLYELEEILSAENFIRISNSEIVNFDKVKSINTKFLGTININFYSGYQTYSSRRYINKIKEFLNL